MAATGHESPGHPGVTRHPLTGAPELDDLCENRTAHAVDGTARRRPSRIAHRDSQPDGGSGPGSPPTSVCWAGTRVLRVRAIRSFVDEAQQCLGDCVGGGRAAGDAEVDGEDVVDRADEVCGGAEKVAAEGAVAEGGDAAGFGHGVVGGEERLRACGW